MADRDRMIEVLVEDRPDLPPNEVFPDEDMQKEVVDFLISEIAQAEKEREPLCAKVQKWRRQREGRPEKDVKNWPWKKSSNSCVPVAAINTQGIASVLMETFDKRDPFWRISCSEDPAWAPHAEDLTELFRLLCKSPYQLDLDRTLDPILYETASLGTQPVKVPWLTEAWTFKARGPQGEIRQVNKVVHDGPAIIPIQFEDFITRPFYYDVQQAPWISHRSWLFGHQMKQRFQQGIFTQPDNWEAGKVTKLPAYSEEPFRRAGIEPVEVELWTAHEAHVFWDVDGDGVPEDIIITFNPEDGAIYRVEFNDLGIREYVLPTYGRRAFQLYGIGVGWMCEHGQDEIDSHHNMRVNGAALANLRMLVARKNCGVSPEETIFPGKIIFVDEPGDIAPIQFGEVYPSSLEAERIMEQYLKQWTAMSDYQMGFNDPILGSRNSVGGTMFLANQGGRILAAKAMAIEEDMSTIGQIILFQLVRHQTQVNLEMFDPARQERLKQVLAMNVEDIPTKFRFQVQTTDVAKTDIAKRQELLTLTQLYTLYFQQITQAMVTAANPQVQQLGPLGSEIMKISLKHYTGATKMMEKILKYFDEIDTGKYLPDIRLIEQMERMIGQSQMQGGMNGQRGQTQNALPRPAGEAPVQGAGGQPGMGLGAPSPSGLAGAGASLMSALNTGGGSAEGF